MTTAEIAKQLVELCRKGENAKVMELYYAHDIVSVEGADMQNMPREMHGIEAVKKKSEWWVSNHTIHSANVTGPYVAVDKFAVVFDYDVTFKPTSKRMKMVEVGVYTVKGGKIVHEEFLYQAA
jgi:SnoaL-like protein